ncbi:hypothetical protein A6V27_01630 [Hafnia alvei]|uniref:DUF2931 family protein n=1 Tax=Hafnia alvei TaxID=569 RepID=UPI0007BCDCFB|nr:DUF2931 family protein [Hafnia alvei]ANC39159.1 hypothetical protein A6V27_01630 [Hafnia alvei]
MKKIILISSLSFLTACQSAVAHEKKGNANYLAPYDNWYFNFVTPKALPALVTYMVMLDTDGVLYKFKTFDSVQGHYESIGGWSNYIFRSKKTFNNAKNPPQWMKFCWDSIIDKKVYETVIHFSPNVWRMMITPEPDSFVKTEIYYHDSMLIGLSPEGKVTAWLSNNGKENIKIATGQTVSGDQLTLCKGVTRFPNGYEYPEMTNEFIKGKIYPYGNW